MLLPIEPFDAIFHEPIEETIGLLFAQNLLRRGTRLPVLSSLLLPSVNVLFNKREKLPTADGSGTTH